MYRHEIPSMAFIFHPALKLGFTHYLLTSPSLKHRSSCFINSHAGVFFITQMSPNTKCARTSLSSFGMRAPRPFPLRTQTMAAARAIVSLLWASCAFVCVSWRPPPPVSLRHVRNAAGEAERGMSGKKSERKGQGRRYLSAQGPVWLTCVSVHYLQTSRHSSSFYTPPPAPRPSPGSGLYYN